MKSSLYLSLTDFDRFLKEFSKYGYGVIGPTVQDGSILYQEVKGSEDLMKGWVDEQAPGTYRLKQTGERFFSANLGQDSWRRFLQKPQEVIWTAHQEGSEVTFTSQVEENKWVFFGVRPCELRAIEIQDRVFLKSTHVDGFYRTRRENILTVAVNCVRAGSNCFCLSMGGSPSGEGLDYDFLLTEVLKGTEHFFLVMTGSERGQKVLAPLGLRAARQDEIEAANMAIECAVRDMSTNEPIPSKGLKEILYAHLESSQWDEIGTRCLSCCNCTLVCPTCFCSTVHETIDLDRQKSDRVRRWDSCFSSSHSYIHGGSVRPSTGAKYRQWLTHKLASWEDQFGISGCVGCGRCITWCPVGIDLRQEVSKMCEKKEWVDKKKEGITR